MKRVRLSAPDACLGIDVSKSTLDLCLQEGVRSKHYRVGNTAKGHAQLLHWLKNRKIVLVHACLEATGSYGEAVAEALYRAGHRVSVVNPKQVKRYRDSILEITKTDVLDSALLAEYCQVNLSQGRLSLWEPLAAEVKTLRDLSRALRSLTVHQGRLRRQQETPGLCRASLASLKRQLHSVEKELERLQEEIRRHVAAHPSLAERQQRIESVCGVGSRTSCVWIAEMGDIRRFASAKAAAKYVGLAPRVSQSGQWQARSQPIAPGGNVRLRAVLYMAAIVAKRHNPIYRAYAHRLYQHGKAPKQIIVAIMRKLVHVLYMIDRYSQAFDPNYGKKIIASVN